METDVRVCLSVRMSVCAFVAATCIEEQFNFDVSASVWENFQHNLNK